MMNYFLVFIGGGLGSICRYGIAHLLSNYKATFPFATLLANVFACLILGYLMGVNMKGDLAHYHRFLFMTGFCGGFSTFSTFSGETLQLFQQGEIFHGFLNIFLSLVVCLICIYLGMKIAE